MTIECNCPWNPDSHADDCPKGMESRIEYLEAGLHELLDCPYVLEEATIPKGGIEVAPQQVVGTMHVSLVRYQRLKQLLGEKKKPTQ